MEEPQSDSAGSDDRSLKTAASLRALRDQADQSLDNHRRHISEIEVRLSEQLQLISNELAREQVASEQSLAASADHAVMLEHLQQAVSEKEAEVEELLDQLTTKSIEFEAQLAERDEELEQVLDLNEEENQQLESLQQELESARQALEDLRTQECTACAQTRAELTEVGQQLNELDEQHRSLLHQQQEQLDKARQTSQSAQAPNEQATAALAEAEQQIAQLSKLQQESEQNEEQLEQTRRKFELALADVHKFKRENAELHEELLSRPAADAQESPELVSLRSERDALAQRVSELENVPAPTAAADGQQELEDLQRRFEMAVDDVRQLKQENADLRQKLDAAQVGSAVIPDEGAQDWQSQKARLLASLDAEDQGEINEARREERATVEGTISITDRVVANKDALLVEQEVEIANLRTQLESRPAGQDLDELREQIAADILGDEGAVQAECEKLQQQQKLLDTKLREAELEISVQRATLARERAAIEEKLAQLPEVGPGNEESSDGKPRRRWLSALGIKDDEED